MTIDIASLSADFAVAPQLAPEHMAEIAKLGYRTVMNNRPDFEAGPSQPTSEVMKRAAQAAGLTYLFIPFATPLMNEVHVQLLRDAWPDLPKPVLAFCRSGTRSSNLFHATF
jgi:uncharacterized protein (TIGR01244 family)